MVIAHGSRAGAANDAHRRAVEALDARCGPAVRPAFLELAGPDLQTAIDGVVAAGATSVAVLPLFLYPGRHVQEDIPALVAAAQQRHPEVPVRLLESFGARPEVADLLATQIAAAVPDLT